MPEHRARVVATTIRSPTVLEAVDGRDNRVAVARLTIAPRDEVDLVHLVAISVARRVIVEKKKCHFHSHQRSLLSSMRTYS